jgi:hypothetical protein
LAGLAVGAVIMIGVIVSLFRISVGFDEITTNMVQDTAIYQR